MAHRRGSVRRAPVRRRPSGRSRSRRGGTLLPIVGFAAVVLVFAGLAAGVTKILWDHDPLDVATLCEGSGPHGASAVLLDLTDPLTDVQARLLTNALAAHVSALAPGTLVAAGAVTSEAGGRGARFARCKPQGGETANPVWQNATLMDARVEDGFEAPFAAFVAEAMAVSEQETSPIVESLAALLAETDAGDGPLDVLVVSDMLQNSDVVSVYRGEDWTTLAARGLDARVGDALAGARVSILMIPRPSATSVAHDAAQRFWAGYLDRQNVASVPLVRVLGDL